MSKNVALFIDVANLYYSARGQEVDVDYVALLKYATKGRDLIRAYAYSGLDPENENQRKFLDFLSKNGYKVVSKDIRKFGDGRVKANLDIELVVDLFRLADRMDIAVIVSGDGDFASAIRALQDVGVRCEVISFRPNTSSDLIAVADEFTDIMKIIGIGRKKGDKGLSMPEMPAKEVNPEFGFRTASRDVAAAALAAIREGDTAPDRRRGGGRRGRKPAPVDAPAAAISAVAEPVEPMTSLEAHAEPSAETGDGEGRRRRRRRGGRGRGRGRRPAAELGIDDEVTGETGEITWEEIDDISQLGELTDLGEPGDEREYAFSEADPTTLAELGLTPDEAVSATAPEAEVQEAAQPKARRSRTGTRRRAAATTKDEGDLPDAPEAASKASARRGGRTTAAQAGGGPTGETAASEPKRASRTRTSSRAKAPETGDVPSGNEGATGTRRRASRATPARRASSTAAASQGDGGQADATNGAEAPTEEQGIWQRFRSGRPAKGSRSG